MLRAVMLAATVLAAGCPSKPPEAPRAGADLALRIRIARAEARRAGGLAELTELATGDDVHARELALRGLGRIGGAQAIAVLDHALADREPRVVAAALTALGVAAALDDKLEVQGDDKLVQLVRHAAMPVRLAAVEALGRAGGARIQATLAECLRDDELAAPCALALGRHGRRKLPLSVEARAALVASTAHARGDVRYAATYALAREHEPPEDAGANGALAARTSDELPDVRATAIGGLAKRKAIASGRKPIEDSLRDRDWRVAVEAIRALAGADDAGRVLVATSLQRRWTELVAGGGGEAHIIIEALRALAGKPITARTQYDAIASLAATAGTETKVPALARGWIECLARLAAPPEVAAQIVESITSCGLPDHLRLPLLAQVVTSDAVEAGVRRAALRVLLGHDDPRVRAAGLEVQATAWKDADARGQATIVSTVTSALASKNPIVAGTAVDAAAALYELTDPQPLPDTFRAALDSSIASRAKGEPDVELAAALFGLIGKRAIAAGADACRAGLAGHPARAKAARECLVALGETVPASEPTVAQLPPGDVAGVIGRKVIWQLVTTRGPIEIELRPDVAPWAVAAIVALTRRGYYDGLELHRVVANFVAQGGDPTMSGWGGPGFTLPAEPGGAADGPGFVAGGVGMADAGPDSAGSQWFVMHGRAPHLDGRYTWIGSVISGQNSADALLIGDRVERATVRLE